MKTKKPSYRCEIVTFNGKGHSAAFFPRTAPGRPAAFRLTWLPVKDEAEGISPPTNEWKKFKSLVEARAAIEASPKKILPVAIRYRSQ